MTRANKLLISLTAVYVVFAGLQWWEMRGQLSQIQRQADQLDSGSKQTDKIITETRRIADSIEDTAKEAKVALDATIAASRLDQRAWVGIKSIDMTPMQAGKPVSVEVHIINSGKTFAIDLKYPGLLQASLTPLQDADMTERGSRPFQQNVIPVLGVLFPNNDVSMPIESAVPITQSMIDGIMSGKVLIYIMGEIFYNDVFKQPHVTRYFFVYTPEDNKFQAQRTHNDAD